MTKAPGWLYKVETTAPLNALSALVRTPHFVMASGATGGAWVHAAGQGEFQTISNEWEWVGCTNEPAIKEIIATRCCKAV
jgi:hypothetical protein